MVPPLCILVCRYYRRLQRRYVPNPELDTATMTSTGGSSNGGSGAAMPADGNGGSSQGAVCAGLDLPIYNINLLRCSMQKHNELLLTEHFQAVRPSSNQNCVTRPQAIG